MLKENKDIKSLSNWVAGICSVLLVFILYLKIDKTTHENILNIFLIVLIIPFFIIIRFLVQRILISIIYFLGRLYAKSNIDLTNLKYKFSVITFALLCFIVGLGNYFDKKKMNSIISGTWEKVLSSENFSYYLNPNTIKKLSDEDEVLFWLKIISEDETYYPMVKIKCSSKSYKIITDSKEEVKLNLFRPITWWKQKKYGYNWKDIDSNSINYYLYEILCNEK